MDEKFRRRRRSMAWLFLNLILFFIIETAAAILLTGSGFG